MGGAAFQRLLRFENPAGKVFYGEAPAEPDPAALLGKKMLVYQGDTPWSDAFRRTEQEEVVHKVLSPLPETPIFHCVGMNYRLHIEEVKAEVPTFPAIFNKPSDALAGPLDDIEIHKDSLLLDYEGELCIIIGKDFKDIKPEEDPFDYVLGYTAGNDVSSRYWQAPGRSSQQAGYAKSFDKFAPIGPYICSTTAVPDPGALTLTTKVNGEVRQQGRTDDLVFDVPAILRFLGRGRTIRKGTVIMTGTPGGVAAFMKPPAWLTDGDVVEVEIEKIGLIRNRFVATP